jgi:hypothetical protein
MNTLPSSWFRFGALVATVTLGLAPPGTAASPFRGDRTTVKFVDISQLTGRQSMVAQGTKTVYNGQPTTVLLPDGRTMYCVWTYGHGGKLGPMKRSDDGGLTWSELLPVPDNWATTTNCPTIYRLVDPHGKARLFVFAGHGPDEGKTMHRSYSEDDGKTWTPMAKTGLGGTAMPFCTIEPIDGGKRLLGMTNIRRPGETKDPRSNVIAQSISEDGGLTWSTPWRIVLDIPDLKPCEPEVIRSPNGKQLLCIMRENVKRVSLFMTSNDEGRTWSKPKATPPTLYGDRHKAKYAPDGRLVICFRDTGKTSPTRNHFVAWVGTYDDIVKRRPGQYRLKLLHNYRVWDCGYSGVEVLPDGTIVATTYLKYTDGPEKNSVVSTRFNLAELDAVAAQPEKKG